MREIYQKIAKWLQEGKHVALAQVTQTWGSSPRRPGSLMAVASDRSLIGSVSGGCVEGSVVQSALDCLSTGKQRTEKFHASNIDSQSVGLSCGGSIHVLINQLEPTLFFKECDWLSSNQEYIRITFAGAAAEDKKKENIDWKQPVEDFLISSNLSEQNFENTLHIQEISFDRYCCIVSLSKEEETDRDKLRRKIAQEAVRCCAVKPAGYIEWEGYLYFYNHIILQPKLVCIGGVHISVHLTQMAKQLGYQTIVIDPRRIFSTQERFPFVDQVIQKWPQEAFEEIVLDSSTAVCALSHDSKLDIPALEMALNSPAFYIGVLGKTTTQLSRYLELKEKGFADEQLNRIYGPIGLDLGGREPSEIALSILSQITMIRSGGKLPSRTILEAVQREQKDKNEKN